MFPWLYYVPLIILGSFFMLNLVLGVLSGYVRINILSRNNCIHVRELTNVLAISKLSSCSINETSFYRLYVITIDYYFIIMVPMAL